MNESESNVIGYVNLYSNGMYGIVHKTKEQAEAVAPCSVVKIATLEVRVSKE